MRAAFYDNPIYRKKQSEIVKRYYTLHPRIKTLINRICNNPHCRLSFQLVKPSNPKRYCSHSCAASINNLKRLKKTHPCLNCGNKLSRSSTLYCSIKCQNNYKFNSYIDQWKSGLKDGSRGINTKGMSKYIRRFLLEKYGEKCSSCGWNKRHLTTDKIPLEINHIDGNSENNKEDNLELLCPNCHALTPNFRNLNKGKGRKWRIKLLHTRRYSN